MNSVNEQYTGNKFVNQRIMSWVLAGVLLALAVNNARSDEISSKVMHHQIEISGFAFIPKQLTVYAGDTVTWINKDIVPHNIFDSTHKKSISPDLTTGETYTFTVESSMPYECELHPSMKGKLSLHVTP